jgi:hypothetical protein
MKTIANLTFAGLIGAASLAILATSASAAIVCNAEAIAGMRIKPMSIALNFI